MCLIVCVCVCVCVCVWVALLTISPGQYYLTLLPYLLFFTRHAIVTAAHNAKATTATTMISMIMLSLGVKELSVTGLQGEALNSRLECCSFPFWQSTEPTSLFVVGTDCVPAWVFFAGCVNADVTSSVTRSVLDAGEVVSTLGGLPITCVLRQLDYV